MEPLNTPVPINARLAGSSTDDTLLPAKASVSIVVTPAPKVTAKEAPVVSAKALVPMLIRLSGNATAPSEVQPSKARGPISCKPASKITDASEVQPANASEPIRSMPAGTLTEAMPEPANAPSAIYAAAARAETSVPLYL